MAGGGASLRRIAQRAERLERDWPRDAADLAKREVESSLRAASGDGSLSHGRSLGRATVVTRAGTGKASVEAGGSIGVWAILETGTRPHDVTARAGRALRTPYGPRPRVHVGGSSGKQAWSRGITRAMPEVARSAADAFTEVMS